MRPETRYVRSGNAHIAYQVIGDAPLDLVRIPGWFSHVDLMWENPYMVKELERIAAFARLIVFDKRGTGASDRTNEPPSLDQHMDDVTAVMVAAGIERAALFGYSEGGPIAALYAATHPERISALAIFGSFARILRAPDYAIGLSPKVITHFERMVEESWGSAPLLEYLAPSMAGNPEARKEFGRFERLAASPGAAIAELRFAAEIDVRNVLPSIRVPTLVMHRTHDAMVPLAIGRFMAEHIPGARFVELPGRDHVLHVPGSDDVLRELEEFLTGVRRAPEQDRVLTTVLFTDIAGSTRQAAAAGDGPWRELLDAHHALVRRQIDRLRGREIKTTGDGFLAIFDGPARAVRCAQAIVEGVRSLGLEVRAGLHTGECEIMGADVGGIAVHIASRVADLASPGEVLVSSTVRDLVTGSGLQFADRGAHELKGVPDAWRIWVVEE